MKHTIAVLVENRFGVLARVAGLFSARGYNIDSLTVSETQDPSVSRMTIVVNAEDERILEQIKKQLNKLIDVITVTDFTKKAYVERELAFIKILIDAKTLPQLRRIIKRAKAEILEKKPDYIVVEVVADADHVRNFINELKSFKVLELVRSGRVAVAI
ncbi:MAG: acetolactate synthase small subunit [Candidatus Omnitrophota bacterium]|jgi:acetolactate synthase-1/3 small subunit|nr:acetolactate synthase small subunit [Candidatus Omnitrophota bacterium]MDD5137805.1 acetolactate synthase small subunit [Candidatus Omnitrophota bacterium]MDD5537824.1 acetolactate synthase small subunit [Candidatus Omnitrophota bacterium]